MSSFRKPFTILRHSPGHYEEGKWIEGGSNPLPIMASVQPITQREVETLPEGKRANDSIKLYTVTEIFETDEKLQREADRFDYRGHVYECVAVFPWQSGVIPHYKAIFNKV